MKEHKKLYKAGKNWVIATMAVASLGIVATQQQVSANSTTADQETLATPSSDAAKTAQQAKNSAQSSAIVADQASTQAKTAVTVAGTSNEYNTQKSVVNKNRAAVDAQQQLVNKKKNQLSAAKQKLAEAENDNKAEAYTAQRAKVDTSHQVLNDKKVAVKQAQDKVNSTKEALKQAPVKINQTQASIAGQNKAIKVAQQNADEANSILNKAQTKLAGAKKGQASAQNLVNDRAAAKQNADNAVTKLETEIKNSGLEQAQQNVTKVQNALNNIKKTNSENEAILTKNQAALADTKQKIDKVNNELKDANKAVTDAQNEVTAKQQAVTEAQNKLANLQKQVAQDEATGAAGFFKKIADNNANSEALREDAQTAYNIVTGQPNAYQDITVDWYKQAVKLGQKDDSTSLNNLEKALGYYQEWMAYRNKYGLKHPSISLTAVAIAMLSSDFEGYAKYFNHPILFENEYGPFYETEEDIATSYQGGYGRGVDENSLRLRLKDPIDDWMSEKDYIDSYIKDHPEAAQYSFEKNSLTQEEWEAKCNYWNPIVGYKKIGHYTSMIKPDANHVGLSTNDYVIPAYKNRFNDMISVGNVTSMDELPYETSNEMNFSDYQNLVHSYISAVKQKDKVDALKQNVETAKKNLAGAQSAVKTAQNNVTTLQKNLADLNAGTAKINQAITDTQKAINKGKQDLAFEQAQLDKANKVVADIKAQIATKTQDLNKAKDVQAKAADALAKAQENLNDANTVVKSAQQDVNNAQKNVNEKKTALTQAQAKLSSLKQELNNLQNTKDNLAKAEAELAVTIKEEKAAEEDVKTQQAALDSLKAKGNDKVSSAQNDVTNAQQEYDATSQKLQDYKNTLSQSETKLAQLQQMETAEKQALVAANQKFNGVSTINNQQPTTDSTANSGVASISTTEKVNTTVTELAVNKETSLHQTAQNAKQLPQTGNDNTVVAGLFGTVLAMFGFGLLKKKHYEG